jgi:hypothetical protein
MPPLATPRLPCGEEAVRAGSSRSAGARPERAG